MDQHQRFAGPAAMDAVTIPRVHGAEPIRWRTVERHWQAVEAQIVTAARRLRLGGPQPPRWTSESNRAKSNGFCLSPSVRRHFCSLFTRAAVTRKARVAAGLAQTKQLVRAR